MNNTTENYNAFEATQPKTEAHVVRAESEVVAGELIIKLSLSDIAKSKPVKGQLGFKLAPISFAVSGRTYRINPGWTTLTGRS